MLKTTRDNLTNAVTACQQHLLNYTEFRRNLFAVRFQIDFRAGLQFSEIVTRIIAAHQNQEDWIFVVDLGPLMGRVIADDEGDQCYSVNPQIVEAVTAMLEMTQE